MYLRFKCDILFLKQEEKSHKFRVWLDIYAFDKLRCEQNCGNHFPALRVRHKDIYCHRG